MHAGRLPEIAASHRPPSRPWRAAAHRWAGVCAELLLDPALRIPRAPHGEDRVDRRVAAQVEHEARPPPWPRAAPPRPGGPVRRHEMQGQCALDLLVGRPPSPRPPWRRSSGRSWRRRESRWQKPAGSCPRSLGARSAKAKAPDTAHSSGAAASSNTRSSEASKRMVLSSFIRSRRDQVGAVDVGEAAHRPADVLISRLALSSRPSTWPSICSAPSSTATAPPAPRRGTAIGRAPGETLLLPGVEPGQEVRRERLQHVGARDLRPRLLAERGVGPVLPFLAGAAMSRSAPTTSHAGLGRRHGAAAMRTSPARAVEQDAPGPAIVMATFGGHSEPRQSPNATISRGAICRARSSATSGSSTTASSARRRCGSTPRRRRPARRPAPAGTLPRRLPRRLHGVALEQGRESRVVEVHGMRPAPRLSRGRGPPRPHG